MMYTGIETLADIQIFQMAQNIVDSLLTCSSPEMASVMPWFRVLPRSRCSKTTVTSTLSEYLDGSLNGPCTPASGGQWLIRYETPSSSRINCQADRQGRKH